MQTDVLIVGAGISGLMAANWLQTQGRRVIVLDKGRGVGGRMATRHIGPGRADHGAQFFTVRHDDFAVYVKDWLTNDVIYEWGQGWSDGSMAIPRQDGYPRYAGRNGMTAVPKYLAQTLDIHLNIRVTKVTAVPSGWQLHDENGQVYNSRALLLTPPMPQSLTLLQASQVRLSPTDHDALAQIKYAPSLTGLFWVNGRVQFPEPGAVQRSDRAITWFSDNQRKGISPEAAIITVQAGPGLSEMLYDASDKDALIPLQERLQTFLEPETSFHDMQLKRWRYALPIILYPERYLLASDLPPLAFAGDAFKEPRVEGAALSGLAAARAISWLIS